jgi:hypothetical protein
MAAFHLDKEPKIEPGFKAPDDYFDHFSAKVMQRLTEDEPRVVSIFARRKTWIYAAVAVVVIALMVPIANTFTNSGSEIDNATIENYLANRTEISNETLKSYASTLEEGRADLVGLYYLYTPKLQELGLVDNWKEVGMEAYDSYIRNGLMTQLVRLELGANIEEAHMRNRQWVSAWVFEKGKADNVIEKITRNGKTYFNITNYEKLRDLFGQLLKETQRIKSEGDYNAGKDLVENYGVKVDQKLHAEVLERNKQFTSAPYSGFVNPVLVPKTDKKGNIISISVKQPKTFAEQMLSYSKNFGFLPLDN